MGACVLAFGTAEARAQDALKVELVPKAQKGQGQPELVVKAQTRLKKLALDVRRSSDGKRFQRAAGPLRAGGVHRFTLPMKRVGDATFEGTLKVQVGGGQSGAMPIKVQTQLLPKLELNVKKGDVDLKSKVLKISSSRPLQKAQVSVMSDVGTPMGTVEQELSGPDGAGKYSLSWKQSRGTVMRISIKGWDPDGFFGGVDLFPWQVDIPHEEVNFSTGSYEITKPESQKLESSYALITDAISRYGKLATIRLFVGGHTDSVGDPASNRTLSNNRARAIGRWFRRRGVKIPVLYAGFGEDQLLVKTPDETDEARNRRAEYIVAVDPPSISGTSAKWRPLK